MHFLYTPVFVFNPTGNCWFLLHTWIGFHLGDLFSKTCVELGSSFSSYTCSRFHLGNLFSNSYIQLGNSFFYPHVFVLSQAICLEVLNISSSMFRCPFIYQDSKGRGPTRTLFQGEKSSLYPKVLPSALTALSTGVINLLRVKSNLRVPPDQHPPRLTTSGKIFLG